MKVLIWNRNSTDEALHDLLNTLSEEYSITETSGEPSLVFGRTSDPERLKVTVQERKTIIKYGRNPIAARGVAYAMAGTACDERIEFKTFGILFDGTRGDIMTVTHLKRWLRRLPLMGYNMVMIYVKDTYRHRRTPCGKDRLHRGAGNPTLPGRVHPQQIRSNRHWGFFI